MNDRRTGGERLLHGKGGGQRLILYDDGVCGGLGLFARFRRDDGDCVAAIVDLFVGKDRLVQNAVDAAAVAVEGNVLVGNDRTDTGHFLRYGRVDACDLCVHPVAVFRLRDEHIRAVHVLAVDQIAGHL